MRINCTFDYDKTLTDEYQQEPLFRNHHRALQRKYPEFHEPLDYFDIAKKRYGEFRSLYMKQMTEDAKIWGKNTERKLRKMGAKVRLAPGLPEFFPRMRQFWEAHATQIDFHVISAGLEEMIKGSPIFKYMNSIHAGNFEYDGEGYIARPAKVMGSQDKYPTLLSIIKGGEELRDAIIHHDDRAYDPRNLICIGDGFSDVPKFTYTVSHGGVAILVYGTGEFEELIESKRDLIARSSAVIPRDYTEGGPMEQVMNFFIRLMEKRADECDRWPVRCFYEFKKRKVEGRRGGKRPLAKKLRKTLMKHMRDCAFCHTVASDEVIIIPPGSNTMQWVRPDKIKTF